AARKLIADDVALRFPQALEDDLLRRLRVDSPERLGIQLLGLDQLSDSRVGLVPTRFVDREFGQWILDLADHLTGTEDALATGLRINSHVDVFAARNTAIGGLGGFLDRPDELPAGDLVFRVEL